ncbi:DUF72 domain-containing protein [Luteimonas deserti]|uniref:DUF72 domain-containing protein n=1 Tax=Luteimonas deserti TaxID=2752306 RepID=A0A7Z0QQM2_9GAMM|nr:DUF72 domain-containing protein [Luteimonas deserti]NYZ61225.1 DUF72 domain-containing protein [Luteimonas deserti]
MSRSDPPGPRGGDLRIGCAGWSIPTRDAALFGDGDSALARYATRFDCVEINSSFYRPHRPSTYARWRASVPADFRFSVKLPRTITHDAALHGTAPLVDAFLEGATCLGDTLGCLLVQLPPALAYDGRVAGAFFGVLRRRWDGDIACEPRHASWLTPRAEALLRRHRIARVAADPPRHVDDARPGGVPEPVYWRWHGSPRIYYDAYGRTGLTRIEAQLRAHPGVRQWVIFDNTAAGHAVPDAAALQSALR